MELGDILKVVWKRLGLILLGTLLIAVMVFVLSKNMKPVYQAKATMMIKQPANVSVLDYTSLLTGEDLALTYSELLKTRPILEIVITNLDLDLSAEDVRDNMLSTQLIPDTQLLELRIEDTDAQRAADIANEIALTFVSLHSTEQQVHTILALEQDVVEHMENLEVLIANNQTTVANSGLPGGLMTLEESNLLQSTLANQALAYTGLLGTFLNIRLTQAQLLDVTVVEPAMAAPVPVRPNVWLYTFLGTFTGLVFTTGLAFLIEYLDRSFETSEELAEILPLPTLGTIPQFAGSERDKLLVTVKLPSSPVSEAFRTLRTNIRFTSVDEPLSTFLVTSPEPGAGKTTTAANLGIAFAQAGLQVLLIDTDLRLPTLNRLFNLGNGRGLTNFLIGDVQSLTECMVETDIENLRLICSGPIPPNPSELLGSNTMEVVLSQARENADLVILDTPPTLAVTDAAVLASRVNGVILLVEAKRTSHEAARRAIEAHQRVGANILGLVLTKAKSRRKSYYYYQAQGHQRSYPMWKRWISIPKSVSSRIFSGKRSQEGG